MVLFQHLRSLARTGSFLSVLIVISCALVGVRFPTIFEWSGTQTMMEASWNCAGIIGWIIVLWQRPRLAAWGLVLLFSLLIHSYSSLYWPSLRHGIPELDFLFFDSVSSNYCFVLAKKYVSNVFLPFFAFAGYFLLRWEHRQLAFKHVIAMLLVALLGNIVVIAFQGWLDINILAQGSGTAITARRAPGLLEDSGASTVVLSGLLTLFWVLIFELDLRRLAKAALLVFWLICAYIGLLTGGRSYLCLLSLGLFFHGLWQSGHWPVLARTVCALCLVSIMGLAAWELKDKLAFGSLDLQAFQNEPLPLKVIGWLDPIRGLHSVILWKSIAEYWPLGLGLGGSHIAIAEHAPSFSSTGIPIAPDAPLNYYLGMMLETGLSGLFILSSLGLLFWNSIVKTWQNSEDRGIRKPLLILLICLFISGLVGTQILLRSYSTLMSLILAFLVIGYAGNAPELKRWKPAEGLLALGIISLLAVSLSKYLNPPMVPEFFWAKQGKPQMPLGYNVPIATPERSQWMAPGVPFAIQGQEINFFVELPPQFYPLQIKVDVFQSRQHKILQTQEFSRIHYDSVMPGKVLSVQLDQPVAEYCSSHYSPTDYCYAKITMDPKWKIARNIIVGYSLISKEAYQ